MLAVGSWLLGLGDEEYCNLHGVFMLGCNTPGTLCAHMLVYLLQ